MDLINFSEVFQALGKERYCVVKFKPFDELEQGDDIDIFTFNVDSTAKIIIDTLVRGKEFNRKLRLHITKESDNKCFVDVLCRGKIYFRFDLYGALPNYTRAKIKPSLFECCVEKATIKKINCGNEKIEVKVTRMEEDRIIRYLEYIEWYERRPDKIKHLEYVLGTFSTEVERVDFFNRLHYYTGFPEIKYEIKKGKNGIIENIGFIVDKCRGKSLGELWSIFKQKFL